MFGDSLFVVLTFVDDEMIRQGVTSSDEAPTRAERSSAAPIAWRTDASTAQWWRLRKVAGIIGHL
jgi:hypothetical protein